MILEKFILELEIKSNDARFNAARKNIKDAEKSLNSTLGAARKLSFILGTVGLAKGLVSDVSRVNTQIDNMADKFNVSSKNIRNLSREFKKTGSDATVLIETLKEMFRLQNLSPSEMGATHRQYGQYNLISLLTKDIREAVNPLEAFQNTLITFTKSNAEQQNKIEELLGYSFRDFIKLIRTNKGEANEKTIKEYIHTTQLQGVVDDETIENATRLYDSLQDLKNMFGDLTTVLSSSFAPLVVKLKEDIKSIDESYGISEKVKSVTEAVGSSEIAEKGILLGSIYFVAKMLYKAGLFILNFIGGRFKALWRVGKLAFAGLSEGFGIAKNFIAKIFGSGEKEILKTPKTSTETPKTATGTPKTSTETPKTSTETPKTSTEIPKTNTTKRDPNIPLTRKEKLEKERREKAEKKEFEKHQAEKEKDRAEQLKKEKKDKEAVKKDIAKQKNEIKKSVEKKDAAKVQKTKAIVNKNRARDKISDKEKGKREAEKELNSRVVQAKIKQQELDRLNKQIESHGKYAEKLKKAKTILSNAEKNAEKKQTILDQHKTKIENINKTIEDLEKQLKKRTVNPKKGKKVTLRKTDKEVMKSDEKTKLATKDQKQLPTKTTRANKKTKTTEIPKIPKINKVLEKHKDKTSLTSKEKKQIKKEIKKLKEQQSKAQEALKSKEVRARESLENVTKKREQVNVAIKHDKIATAREKPIEKQAEALQKTVNFRNRMIKTAEKNLKDKERKLQEAKKVVAKHEQKIKDAEKLLKERVGKTRLENKILKDLLKKQENLKTSHKKNADKRADNRAKDARDRKKYQDIIQARKEEARIQEDARRAELESSYNEFLNNNNNNNLNRQNRSSTKKQFIFGLGSVLRLNDTTTKETLEQTEKQKQEQKQIEKQKKLESMLDTPYFRYMIRVASKSKKIAMKMGQNIVDRMPQYWSKSIKHRIEHIIASRIQEASEIAKQNTPILSNGMSLNYLKSNSNIMKPSRNINNISRNILNDKRDNNFQNLNTNNSKPIQLKNEIKLNLDGKEIDNRINEILINTGKSTVNNLQSSMRG